MAPLCCSKGLKTRVFYVLPVLICASLCLAETSRKRPCHDAEGNAIPDGSNFIPDKKDPCQTCRCEDGYSIMCTAVSCSPPDCVYKAIDGKCCEFVCEGPQPSYPQTPGVNGTGRTKPIDRNGGGITNLGLRLVASTITSFLVLALLLFMIHKLRQRRLFMSVRRLNSSRRRLDELDHERYINESPPMGLTVPPYQDPPPPYSPPKPPSNIAPGEPPPPYEAINNNNAGLPLDLPPAYQQGASSLPYIGAANSRTHTTSESSCTSDSEWLGPRFSSPDNSARSTNRNQNERTNRSVNANSSVEDTRVKEVFEQSWRSAQRSLGSAACTSTDSIKSDETAACETADNTHHSQGSQHLPRSNSRSQNVINIFGPRCIKKSGSVEILRQSISPRNSYYLDGVSAAEVMSQSLDPSMLNRMLNGTGVGSPETSLNGTESTSRLQNLNSEADTSLTSDPSNASPSGISSVIRQMDASDRRRQFRLSNLLHSPIESTESPTSPLSPAGANLTALRSNSIHSDLSWFSVCSETGEPRLRKSVITSDSKYPEYRHAGTVTTPAPQSSCKFVPKIPSPSHSPSTREDNSIEPKTQFNFPNLCLTRNYSTERFDRLNNLRNGSAVHRSLSDINLNKNLCQRQNLDFGDCMCKSCDKGTYSSGAEPWVMNTTNQNTLCASKNQSYFSVDDAKSSKRKDRDSTKKQSGKPLKKLEKALSTDSANGNESLLRNINKFGSLGKNYLSPKKDGKTLKSTNNRDCDNSTLCAKTLTKSPKKPTKAESVTADLRNNKRNKKSSDNDKKVHKPKTMLCSDV